MEWSDVILPTLSHLTSYEVKATIVMNIIDIVSGPIAVVSHNWPLNLVLQVDQTIGEDVRQRIPFHHCQEVVLWIPPRINLQVGSWNVQGVQSGSDIDDGILVV